jgi:hypothetical protein
MPYPIIYAVAYSYSGFQQSQGNNAFPGTQIDADLLGLTANISSLSTFMKNVMRSDGALNNGIVTYDSLSPSLQTAGLAPATAWAPGVAYPTNASVINGSSLYRALAAHTSGVFATDLAAAKWLLVAVLPIGPNPSDYATRALAIAATIAAPVQYIRLAGYAAAGDGGAALYKRVGALAANVYGFQSGDGAWWQYAETTINILAFGADRTATADSTAAINAAIAHAATMGNASIGIANKGTLVYFPAGCYSVGSINCTKFSGLTLFAAASSVILYCNRLTTPAPVVDFTGSSGCNITGIIVSGSLPFSLTPPSVLPTVGILLAGSTLGGDSNKVCVTDCGSLGFFSVAPVYLYNSSDNIIRSSGFQQGYQSGKSLFVGTTNIWAVSSLYATIATASTNAGDNTFLACEWHNMSYATPAVASTAPTIHFYGAANQRFFGGNCASSGGPQHVLFEGSNREIIFSGTTFYSDSGTAALDVFYSNGADVQDLVIDAVDTRSGSFSRFFVNGTGGAAYNGGSVRGVWRTSLTGPFLYFFATTSFSFGSPNTALATNTTAYLSPSGIVASEGNAAIPVVRSGVLTGLRVISSASPGASQSFTYVVRKNYIDTAITGTIAGAGTTTLDTTNQVVVAPGDAISIRVTSSNGANVGSGMWATIGFIPS